MINKELFRTTMSIGTTPHGALLRQIRSKLLGLRPVLDTLRRFRRI